MASGRGVRAIRFCTAAVALVWLAVASIPAASTAAGGPAKVAFVEFSTGQGSAWVRANEIGADYVKTHVQGVQVKVIESITEGPGVVPVLQQLGREGYAVVFADSYGYQNFTKQVAPQYPKTVFINEEATYHDGNLGSFYGRLEEARYLEGIVAGMMTKSNIIGFAGGYAVPPVIIGLDAFALGVQSVNPRAVVDVTWVHSWYDPPKEKEAADALLNVGADIIANHADSPATLQAAAARGKYGMTSNADYSAVAPKAYLTGTVWNWGPYFARTVEAVMNHTWRPAYFDGTLANGAVGLGPWGDAVPQAVRARVAAVQGEIVSGKRDPLRGPIYDQSGRLRVPAGTVMSAHDRAGIGWLVKGIKGTTK
jgi:basic membrane protein A